MEKMPGHPRLYRRGAVYWHRASVPVDIAGTYPKTEETFSLRTKDHREALKLVRVEAVRVDRLFDEHRRGLALQAQPPLEALTDEQIKRIGEVYYAHLLDEDDEVRNEAFEGRSFEEWAEDIETFDASTRDQYARGEVNGFYVDEVDEVLSWTNVNLRLAEVSPSRHKMARELQATAIRAYKAKRARNEGEPVETPHPALLMVSRSKPVADGVGTHTYMPGLPVPRGGLRSTRAKTQQNQRSEQLPDWGVCTTGLDLGQADQSPPPPSPPPQSPPPSPQSPPSLAFTQNAPETISTPSTTPKHADVPSR